MPVPGARRLVLSSSLLPASGFRTGEECTRQRFCSTTAPPKHLALFFFHSILIHLKLLGDVQAGVTSTVMGTLGSLPSHLPLDHGEGYNLICPWISPGRPGNLPVTHPLSWLHQQPGALSIFSSLMVISTENAHSAGTGSSYASGFFGSVGLGCSR